MPGGSLKFKGDGGAVSKKKKSKKQSIVKDIDPSKFEEALDKSKQDASPVEVTNNSREQGTDDETPPTFHGSSNKTAAELRFEERRRKRLEENLKTEGAKTHKEKVKDLNRYLSKLSEHHDMPKIGPG